MISRLWSQIGDFRQHYTYLPQRPILGRGCNSAMRKRRVYAKKITVAANRFLFFLRHFDGSLKLSLLFHSGNLWLFASNFFFELALRHCDSPIYPYTMPRSSSVPHFMATYRNFQICSLPTNLFKMRTFFSAA